MDLQLILLIILVAGIGSVIYFLTRKPKTDQSVQVMLDWMKSLQEKSDLTRKEIQDSISSSNKDINNRLTEAARLFSDVQRKVGEMTELGRSMKDVQDLLKGPKTRGIFGEDALEMLLKQVLPQQSYQMQYRFESGEIVDCVIRLKEGLICVDSKFPLENFRALLKAENEVDVSAFRKAFARDVKKHVEAIAKKYILPNEGTLDFALMYVPMESVFQEIVNDQELNEYSRAKKVFITSPNSFYNYITTISNVLKGAKMNELARQVLNLLGALKQDSDKFTNPLGVLTKHVTNAKSTVDSVNDEFRALTSKIDRAQTLQIEEKKQVEEIASPKLDL
ncbi:MAG: hypothetical protein A2846_00220 [Candidatus Doudnabacteria bacterium RIFCSPHIGHO2_01_FULL_49_9]|uniref:DNA recombination protein RmuC n=1 Tax=Candidatus Doudnabacteria bacterium RIFCSPHIGHO2_01_FULL_49_9 TaxID=1817827 RepID=A0A1F5P226_9BACT|nr:MAG: hypothetical protein A2846_00220 [Candidatus Doudnabacteria bacterium RIFCSPHIGHO2_01_FULL_49_9]